MSYKIVSHFYAIVVDGRICNVLINTIYTIQKTLPMKTTVRMNGLKILINIIFLVNHTCKAAGLPEITSEASFKALDAFISPSAAITFARASLAASASAAIALCSCTGRRTSLL